MELLGTARSVRRRWLLAGAGAVVVLLAVGGAVGIAAAQAHRQTARVLVAVDAGTGAHLLAGRSAYGDQVVTSYARVATTPLVLDAAIAELGLHASSAELARRVTASVEQDAHVIDVSVTGGSAEESARIANAVGGRLVAVSGSLVPTGSAAKVELRVVEPAAG